MLATPGILTSGLEAKHDYFTAAMILRPCGLALSNKKCQTSIVTAAMGVSMCEEYFHDLGKQGALVGFMSHSGDQARMADL